MIDGADKKKIEQRVSELETQLANPAVMQDAKKLATLGKEYGEIKPVLDAVREYETYEQHIATAIRERESTTDIELRALADQEIADLTKKQKTPEITVHEYLHPSDPMDSKDILVEIRAGTGGDEAGLFAADLFRMYQRYADARGWKTALLSADRTSVGGYKDAVFSITGRNAYKYLKHESGVHRVQRIPDTEKSGRVHTSTATVAIMPKVEAVDMELDPNDLLIEVSTSQGHGGQSVNTTYSAIFMTHKPTGITVSCQDERSQVQNKMKAMEIMRARVYQYQIEKQRQENRDARRSQIGGAKRAEKIRTYNFSQDRVTDHRLNQNFHNLPAIMEGKLDDMIEALQKI